MIKRIRPAKRDVYKHRAEDTDTIMPVKWLTHEEAQEIFPSNPDDITINANKTNTSKVGK